MNKNRDEVEGLILTRSIENLLLTCVLFLIVLCGLENIPDFDIFLKKSCFLRFLYGCKNQQKIH